MKDIIESLNEYGFSRNESLLYSHLLSNQDSPAYAIAQKVGIPRTTVYKTLEILKKQGFVSSWIKNGVKHFSAENPEILTRRLKAKEQSVTQALPEMIDLFNLRTTHPSSKMYEGKEGVKEVFEQTLSIIKNKKIKRILAFSDKNITEQLPKFYRNWKDRKNEAKAFTQLIVPSGTPMTDDYKSYEFRETRVMPESFPFEGGMDIVGSFVAFFSFRDGQIYAVTIDSPIIADMMTKFFTYIWGTLEKNGE
jgi:sugar-specific transcriptional regulator TrmB